MMDRFYVLIAKIESAILSMVIAFGTLQIIGLVTLVGVERLIPIKPVSAFSVFCIMLSVFVIWFWGTFIAFMKTNKFLLDIFKIEE